jgi:hypothetical protein
MWYRATSNFFILWASGLTNQEEAAVETGVYSPLRSRDATIFEPPELFNTNKREHQRQQQARQVRELVTKFSFCWSQKSATSASY